MFLESLKSATSRGAKIYAELAGFGMSSDAFHMTAPDVNGPKRCMENALKDAELDLDAVSYITVSYTHLTLPTILLV